MGYLREEYLNRRNTETKLTTTLNGKNVGKIIALLEEMVVSSSLTIQESDTKGNGKLTQIQAYPKVTSRNNHIINWNAPPYSKIKRIRPLLNLPKRFQNI